VPLPEQEGTQSCWTDTQNGFKEYKKKLTQCCRISWKTLQCCVTVLSDECVAEHCAQWGLWWAFLLTSTKHILWGKLQIPKITIVGYRMQNVVFNVNLVTTAPKVAPVWGLYVNVSGSSGEWSDYKFNCFETPFSCQKLPKYTFRCLFEFVLSVLRFGRTDVK